MYAEILTVILAAVTITSVSLSVLILRRVRKQLSEMSHILKDIEAGNGNRRILSGTHELTAPIAFQINDIVLSYEKRLSAYHQMEDTNRQLMTSLSHDVRTPLTTLIGYLDATHRENLTDKEKNDYVETARRKAHDLKDYIDVLFDWFKLGSGEFSLNPVAADLTELTRQILIDWLPVLEEKQITYEVDIPERLFHARLDSDGYMRIVNNLIQNVIAHSKAGRIGITLSEQNGEIALQIADNGVGIPKEDLKHIFERLYKCDKGRSAKGSGLGLSIALELAGKMGGNLGAESEPGKGTVFTLSFPSCI